LTNHTRKIQKEQLNKNVKYNNKRQLKRNGGSNVLKENYLVIDIIIIIIK
jgi:hypothetical protein